MISMEYNDDENMNVRITVRLPHSQIVSLKAYAKENSITFSAALRRYLVMAIREMEGKEKEEDLFSRIEKLEYRLRELGKSIEGLKLLYPIPTNSDGVH
jgi:predicted ribosome quality control (RQC) complex YloA/Tae2 family protein